MNNSNLAHLFTILWNRFIIYTILITFFINLVIGVIWTFINISVIPQYGDTNEYLECSRHLIVDQYRGIIYPYFLNISSRISDILNIKIQHVVYSAQMLLTLFSIYCFASAIALDKKTNHNNIRHQLPVIFTSMVVSLNPLVIHFSLTVLTDSLATSCLMIFMSFLIFYFKDKKNKILCITLSALFFVLMSLLRIEKVYLGSFLYLSFIILLVLQKSKKDKIKKKVAVSCALLSFGISISIINIIKKEHQVYNLNRPSLTIYNLAFNRIVWPNMSDAYTYYPANVKTKFSAAEAKEFDKHNNNVYPFLVKHLQENDGRKIIYSITLTTLKHFPIKIIARTTFDFIKYTLPNLVFPLEILNILPTSVATSWTMTRMYMFSPTLTSIFLFLGTLSFFLMLVHIFIVRHSLNLKKTDILNFYIVTFIIILLCIVTNSMLFALTSGMNAHIRYALPTYTITLTITVLLVFTHIFYLVRKPFKMYIKSSGSKLI